MNEQIIFTQNDSGIEIQVQFTDTKKVPTNITGCSVEIVFVAPDGTKMRRSAYIIDAAIGKCGFVITDRFTEQSDLYTTYWSATDVNGFVTAQEALYYYVMELHGGNTSAITDPTPATANRSFLLNPIDLETEVTGVLPIEKMETSPLVYGTTTINGHMLGADVTLTASDVGAIPSTRTVNGKALSSNITLTTTDIGAVAPTRTINGKSLANDVVLTSGDVGSVPLIRTVNGKSLSGDIDLVIGDVITLNNNPDYYIGGDGVLHDNRTSLRYTETKTGRLIYDTLGTQHEEYQILIDMGSLPNTANTIKEVPHGLTNIKFTRVNGMCYGNDHSFSLPYGTYINTDEVRFYADSINIVIGVGKDRSMYTATAELRYYKL